MIRNWMLPVSYTHLDVYKRQSFLIPFAVLLSVPFGLMGSFLFAKMMGLENNIYLQTGLIMLVCFYSRNNRNRSSVIATYFETYCTIY